MDEEQKEEKKKKENRRKELKDELKKEIKDEMQSEMKDEIEVNARLIRDEIKAKDEKLDNMYKLLQKMDKVISSPSTTGLQRPKTSGN